MKTLFTAAAAVACVLALAGEAYAASSAQCTDEANAAVQNATHPLGAAAIGCGLGALAGQLLSNGNGGAIAGGCAAGAAGGVVLSAAKQQEIFNTTYSDCMNGNSFQATEVDAGPAPSGVDGGFTVFSPEWMDACDQKYKTFNMDGPHAGQYVKAVDPTVWAWCNLPG